MIAFAGPAVADPIAHILDHQHVVRGFLKRRVRPADLDDLVQVVMVRAWQAGHDGRASMTTWLCAIAKHVAIDHYRKRPWYSSDKFDRTVDHRTDAPDAGLMAEDERAEVMARLACLTPRQAEVVELRYLKSFSIKRIAEHLGVTLGTVKATLSQAREKLAADTSIRE